MRIKSNKKDEAYLVAFEQVLDVFKVFLTRVGIKFDISAL